MTTKPIFTKISDLKDKVEELHNRKLIIPSTYMFLKEFLDQVEDVIKLLRKETCEERTFDKVLKHIIVRISSTEEILKSIEEGKHISNTIYLDFVKEIADKLHEKSYIFDKDLEIIVVPVADTKILSSYPYLSNENFTFILFVGKDYHPLNEDLIGLVAHEVAHTEKDVGYATINSKRRKIRESLVDLLAHMMTGILYIHSVNYWISNIVGIKKCIDESPSHPTWITRIIVINDLSKEVWTNNFLLRTTQKYARKFIKKQNVLTTQEHLLLSRCIREGEQKIERFNKYKINERLVGNQQAMRKSPSMVIQLNGKVGGIIP
ncbi:MAG: hypothetical protein QMC80_02175 [Thermoplasmatales archaeon]|nr:hypothetical protein [Thermoplasmatales archaeon]